MIAIQDWFAMYLFALQLTFIARAIIETLAVGWWPANGGSQVWLILIMSVFFMNFVDMLVRSTLQTTIALASFFLGLSFLVPVWASFQLLVENTWYSAFGSELSEGGAIVLAITVLSIVAAIVVGIKWKGWVHTLAIGTLITIDGTMCFHLLVYNVRWGLASDFMTTPICCSVPGIVDYAIHDDGNLCPVRFTWLDIFTFVSVWVFFIPVQFFRREQCLPLWCCCRRRARATALHRRLGEDKYKGFSQDYKLVPEQEDMDSDESDESAIHQQLVRANTGGGGGGDSMRRQLANDPRQTTAQIAHLNRASSDPWLAIC